MSDPKDVPPDDIEIKKHYGMETGPSGSDNDDSKDERHAPTQRVCNMSIVLSSNCTMFEW